MKKIEFSKDIREGLITHIQEFFRTEKSEDVSKFQAETILNFVIDVIGPHIYNQAITDAHAFMLDKLEDMYGLEKRPR